MNATSVEWPLTPIPETTASRSFIGVASELGHAPIPDHHPSCPVRLLAVYRDRNAGLRAGAGGFHSGAHSERAEYLRPGGGATEARPAGAQGLPGLQGGPRPPAHSRLDLERAHAAVPEGPDRQREPRGDWVPR